MRARVPNLGRCEPSWHKVQIDSANNYHLNVYKYGCNGQRFLFVPATQLALGLSGLDLDWILGQTNKWVNISFTVDIDPAAAPWNTLLMSHHTTLCRWTRLIWPCSWMIQFARLVGLVMDRPLSKIASTGSINKEELTVMHHQILHFYTTDIEQRYIRNSPCTCSLPK